jgi:hypothetical protein
VDQKRNAKPATTIKDMVYKRKKRDRLWNSTGFKLISVDQKRNAKSAITIKDID